MAGEAVKKLIDAEREIAHGIEEAKTAAKKLIADAETRGNKLLLEEEEDAIKREAELISKAEKEAIAEKAQIEAAAEAEREKLTTLAAGKLEAAASLITERVVNG